MADRLPAKILPITVLMISVAIPYFQPSKIAERRMNALEIPSLAPGKMIGGKRFSSIKDIRAAAERIPHNEILKEVFITHPATGSPIPLLDSGESLSLCGAQTIAPLSFIFGE